MSQNPPRTSRYVGDYKALDPVTQSPVDMEIHVDPATGGMFAVDFSFIDQVSEKVFSPFDGVPIELQEPPESVAHAHAPSREKRHTMTVVMEIEALCEYKPPVAGLRFVVNNKSMAGILRLASMCARNDLTEVRRAYFPEWLFQESQDDGSVRGLDAPEMCISKEGISFTGYVHNMDDDRMGSAEMDLRTLKDSYDAGVKLLVLATTYDSALSFLDRVSVPIDGLVPGQELRVFGPSGEVMADEYADYQELEGRASPSHQSGG